MLSNATSEPIEKPVSSVVRGFPTTKVKYSTSAFVFWMPSPHGPPGGVGRALSCWRRFQLVRSRTGTRRCGRLLRGRCDHDPPRSPRHGRESPAASGALPVSTRFGSGDVVRGELGWIGQLDRALL